jgi:histidinol-phosphatase
MQDYRLDLDRALQLADVADTITIPIFRSNDLAISTKPDNTPVTKGDIEVEKQLSAIVAEQFKESYLGEEGTRMGGGNRAWTVDPIDGTKNFLRGMPIWATLIALSENGEVVAACMSAPALGRRWWAAKGLGAWTKDPDGHTRRLHVSGVTKLQNAFLLTASLSSWDKTRVGSAAVLELIKSAWRYRAVGDFFNYALIAEGAADICVESDPKAWDLAAPELILKEAGGTLWTNATEASQPGDPRIAIATNAHLEAAVRQALGL